MQCSAGIVLYNPELERLMENIDAIYFQVDYLIIVDNDSKNQLEIRQLVKNKYPSCSYICNSSNMGIAYALNQIIRESQRLQCSWVLTLEQDSVCCTDLINRYKSIAFSDEKIGIVTCNFRDRNIDLPLEQEKGCKEVDFCITSAAFTNVVAVCNVGGFDERLFIDMVDYDICYNLRRFGYKIIKIDFCGFTHEVGKGTEIDFLGRKRIVYNHSSLRKYYWARNSIYLVRKYKLNPLKGIVRIMKRMGYTLLFENEKIKKCHSMIKGILDGILM